MRTNDFGWIISLFMRISERENQADEEHDGIRKEYPYLSWSPYDRMDIVCVDEFSSFFENQFMLPNKLEVKQMHIIPVYPENLTWKVDRYQKEYIRSEKSSEKQSMIRALKQKKDGDYQTINYGLNTIIAVRFNSVLSQRHVYEFCEELESTVKKEVGATDIMDWAAFESLGAEDIVFIVLANDILSIEKFIHIIKNSKYIIKEDQKNEKSDVCESIICISGFNISDWGHNTGKSGIKKPGADIHVHLTLKSDACIENIEQEIERQIGVGREAEEKPYKISYPMLGKAMDIEITDSEKIFSLYCDDGIFNGESKQYYANIKSSQSYWFFSEKENTTPSFVMEIEKDGGRQKVEKIDNDKLFLHNKELEHPMASVVLDKLCRMIQSEKYRSWKEILYSQYVTINILAKNYEDSESYNLLDSLLGYVQSELLHITQACSLLSESAYYNYFYFGSYHKILKMYYGIISTMLEIGYKMPHERGTNQYEIHFCVDFENTSRVHSNMLMLEDDVNTRFVVFHLPFNAFAKINTTAPIIMHEVFHYIAPYNRKNRNENLVKLWLKAVFFQVLDAVFEIGVEREITDELCLTIYKEDILEEWIEKFRDQKEIDFSSYIMNDFLAEGNLSKILVDDLREIAAIITEYIFNKIDDEKKKGINDKFEKFNNVQMDGGYLSINDYISKKIYWYDRELLRDELKNFALASKEASGDLNMIFCFGMEVIEYLELLYKILIEQKGLEFTGIKNSSDLEDKDIWMGSFEVRLGIVLDGICIYDENTNRDEFVGYINKSLSNFQGSDDEFDSFVDYCKGAYSGYIKENKENAENYYKIIKPIVDFWKNEKKEETIQNLISKLKKIGEIKDSVRGSFELSRLFFDTKIPAVEKEEDITYPESRDTKYIQSLRECFERDETRYVGTIGDYINRVCEIVDKLENNNVVKAWYRGECNKEFKSLPGIFRPSVVQKYIDENINPATLQYKILHDARYLTIGNKDLWENLRSVEEQTYFLQHYGMPTNLLDFSRNMLVALYFAVNPENEKDKEMVDEGKYIPKVVVFQPEKYNAAICAMNSEEEFSWKPHMYSYDLADYYKNAEAYFFVEEDLNEESKKRNVRVPLVKNRGNIYPKAMAVPQTNSRILAQDGAFLAYDLNSFTAGDTFEQLSIQEIEEQFKQFLIEKNIRNISSYYFMEEIYIEPHSVDAIRRQLKKMGFDEGKVYTEIYRKYSKYLI